MGLAMFQSGCSKQFFELAHAQGICCTLEAVNDYLCACCFLFELHWELQRPCRANNSYRGHNLLSPTRVSTDRGALKLPWQVQLVEEELSKLSITPASASNKSARGAPRPRLHYNRLFWRLRQDPTCWVGRRIPSPWDASAPQNQASQAARCWSCARPVCKTWPLGGINTLLLLWCWFPLCSSCWRRSLFAMGI